VKFDYIFAEEHTPDAHWRQS